MPKGRFVAHDKHVLSMKDNNQSANLAALVDAGIRSFKIEGRYKDMGYVKNITGHYRVLLDALMDRTPPATTPWCAQQRAYPPLRSCPTLTRTSTANSPTILSTAARKTSAPSTAPKTRASPSGMSSCNWAPTGIELRLTDRQTVPCTTATACVTTTCKRSWWAWPSTAPRLISAKTGRWRVFPKDALAGLKDLRKGVEVNRNRDVDWLRASWTKSPADRRIGVCGPPCRVAMTSGRAADPDRRRRLHRHRAAAFSTAANRQKRMTQRPPEQPAPSLTAWAPLFL
jgi:hypothetical protein